MARCAYDALIAAPKATLFDIAMLIARPPTTHSAKATVSAMQAYWPLVNNWAIGYSAARPNCKALVVSSNRASSIRVWIFLQAAGRFIDNPNHIFRLYVKALALAGVDVVFAASNCGDECATAVCLGQNKQAPWERTPTLSADPHRL